MGAASAAAKAAVAEVEETAEAEAATVTTGAGAMVAMVAPMEAAIAVVARRNTPRSPHNWQTCTSPSMAGCHKDTNRSTVAEAVVWAVSVVMMVAAKEMVRAVEVEREADSHGMGHNQRNYRTCTCHATY